MAADDLTPDQRAAVAAAFEPAFYLARNPDVADSGVDPLSHFLETGWREGRDPARRFSLAAYREANPDVARAGINPFVHYVLIGKAEGREGVIDLGFRYDLLKDAPSLADQLETNRGPAPPAGGLESLAVALEPLAGKLFISVSHDAYVDVVGGVQLCLRREAAAVAEAGYARLHLYPAVPWWVTDFETLDPVMGIVVDGQKRGLFKASQIAAALQQSTRIVETHFAVHSLLGHTPPAVSAVLESAGAREGFFWLHDQSSLCASYALLRNDVAFCGAPPPDSPACSICTYGLRRISQIADHAAFFRRHSLTVLSPSQAQLELWLRAGRYPHAAARVHPHALFAPGPAPAAAPAPEGPLTVAFLGFPANHKGWPIFVNLAERFADDPRYAFIHLGRQDHDPPPIPFIPVSGADSDPSPMVQAVAQAGVDVALILSICPETFCFTAHEAAAAGAAVVAFADSGALARFAADPAVGRVLEDEKALTALFDSGEIAQLSRRARQPTPRSLRYSRLTADFLEPAA